MRHAATLATPETECLLYATYWFRPILSELIGAATETALISRNRAPSGPVKVTVTTQPHERPHGGISLTSGVSLKIVPHRWSCQKFVSRLGVFHSRIMETFELWNQRLGFGSLGSPFFLTGALCLSAGRGVLRLTRLPRHDRGRPVFFSFALGRCRSEARSLDEHKLSERHLYKDTVGP